MGRQWYECPKNKCPKHVNKKIQTKHWPKGKKALKGMWGPHVIIQAKYHGRPIQAIIDSGATRNFISKKFVEKSGLPHTNKEEKKTLYNIKGLPFTEQIHFKTKPGAFLSKGLVINNLTIDLAAIDDQQEVILGIP